ncbi:MAG: hypothetical protein HQ538_01055 [Parcubacteria group bacterium]|nr:hypothetical protein [Parcubacteria group bacterium]
MKEPKNFKSGMSTWYKGSEFLKIKAQKIYKEERTKEKRLNVLNENINLPVGIFEKFNMNEWNNKRFKKFFKESGNKLYSLRLVPLKKGLPTLRKKCVPLKETLKWLDKQKINKEDYSYIFKAFTKNVKWSTVFVVNDKGISGEIYQGILLDLIRGSFKNNKTIKFYYDFKKWQFSRNVVGANKFIKKVTNRIKVNSASKRNLIKNKIKTKFANNYIKGYFECIDSVEYDLWFVDYSRVIGDLYSNFDLREGVLEQKDKKDNQLAGYMAYPGKLKGKVKIILNPKKVKNFRKDSVLVTKMTDPKFISLMEKSGAIITEIGGILSHAAIVARELKKPCLVGVKNATKILRDGDIVEVNANKGIIRKLK